MSYLVHEKRRQLLQNKSCLLHQWNRQMHLLTTSWESDRTWPRGTWPYWNNLFTHLILLHIIYFLQAQWNHQGTRFEGHQKGRKDGAEGYPRRIFPAMYRSLTEGWESLLDTRRFTLKKKSLSLGIKKLFTTRVPLLLRPTFLLTPQQSFRYQLI